MHPVSLSVLLLLSYIIAVHGAVVQKSDVIEITSQGLYSKNHKVIILAKDNFDMIYGQKHAWLVQFYNSFCGHCRAFFPKFKEFAADVEHWTRLVHIGVFDCSVEENVEVCRQFEVMQYPSLRYLHENYTKGNTNIGEVLDISQDPEILVENLLNKFKDEHSHARLAHLPSLEIGTYKTYAEAMHDTPAAIKYTFMVFETQDSIVGTKLILDTTNYEGIAIKRVLSTSKLAQEQGVNRFPSLVAVRNDLQVTALTPKNPSRHSLLHAINIFLESKNMALPSQESSIDHYDVDESSTNVDVDQDAVYLADLETAVHASLHTEIPRYKSIRGEALQALLNYLTVLIDYFPFRANGKDFLVELKGSLISRSEWTGDEVLQIVQRLESSHAPAYATHREYISCRGSEQRYRGYTCGLWSLFHTLTVAAATQSGGNAPNVLRAMHGYVKHFFGCTDCVQHFLNMSERNKIFEVQLNDKAVLWLWIAHNEVNLRLAGDVTEDPKHPKIQYPSVERCSECRLARGAWRLSAVYRYLRGVYAAAAVRPDRLHHSAVSTPLTALDVGITAVLSMGY